MLITDAAVQETAANLAQSLGGDWELDPTAPADGAAHLIYSDGRGIGIRPIFGGTTVQLWITGNPVPTPPDGSTPAEQAAHEAQIAPRLPEGRRYNKATTLVTEDDEDPADIILRTLEDHLLPAFEYKPRYVGHRPWIDLFDNVLAAVTAERDTPSAPDDNDQDPKAEPNPQDKSEPEPDGGGEEAAAEEPAPQKQASGEAPSLERDTTPEAAPAPTPDDVDNGTEHQPAPEAGPATSRRRRERSPKRRAAAAATEPAS